ncbi:HYR domain-containing protein, partial [Lutibacter litoralis]
MFKKLLNLKIYILLFLLFIRVNASLYANSSEQINYVELNPALEQELDNPLLHLDEYFEKIIKSDLILELNDVKILEKVDFDKVCPIDVIVSSDPGACGAVVNYTPPTPTASSGNTINQIAGLPSGSTFPVGTITNTFQELDSGSIVVNICSFTITVNDTQAPTASNPAAINVQCLGDVPAV